VPICGLFLFLASFLLGRDVGTSRKALGTIADRPLRDRDEGLRSLVGLSLVNWDSGSGRFWLLPLVQE
jgi:hypothetical protein